MITSKALVTRVGGNEQAYLHLNDIELGSPGRNQVLLRVHFVAQNPTDDLKTANTHMVQSLDSNAFGEDAVLGCDFVGTVEALGENVTLLEVGDLIVGLIWGGEIKGFGAYSEYVFADERICFKVPKAIPEKEAATVPLASATAWLALYSQRCLNIDRHADQNTPVLIWVGSSSVGLYAIQLAHLFSILVVAICSSKHFELCKSMGVDNVFDYRDQELVKKVKTEIPNIYHAFDCIGAGTSSKQASRITQLDGILTTVRPGKANTEDVEKGVRVTDVLVWTAFLKDHYYKDFAYPASKEDNDLSAELFSQLPQWLESGKLKANTAHILPGGLSAVKKGFKTHREGYISGYKIVYEL